MQVRLIQVFLPAFWLMSLVTAQPALQPTVQPSFQSTQFSMSKVITATIDSPFVTVQFNNIGYAEVYISVVMYISWFSYGSGGFVQVVVGNATNSGLICSDTCAPSDACSASTTVCAINMDVTSYVTNQDGGSLSVLTFSNSTSVDVLPPTCSFEGSSNVEYVLTITLSRQAIPTFQPTPTPTLSYIVVTNNVVDFSATTYFIIGICMVIYAAVATMVVKVRSKYNRIVAIKLIDACAEFVILGSQMITEIFYVTFLLQKKRVIFDTLAFIILFSRFINLPAAVYFLNSIFGSGTAAVFYDGMLDRKHFRQEKKAYVVVALLMLLDVGLVKYLPWNNSEATSSKLGYPFERIRLVCVGTRLVHSTMAIIVQSIMFEHYKSVSSISSAEYGVFVLYIIATVAGALIVLIQGFIIRCGDLGCLDDYLYESEESGIETNKKSNASADRNAALITAGESMTLPPGGDGVELTSNPLHSSAQRERNHKDSKSQSLGNKQASAKDFEKDSGTSSGSIVSTGQGEDDLEAGHSREKAEKHVNFVEMVQLPAVSIDGEGGQVDSESGMYDDDCIMIATMEIQAHSASPRGLKMNNSFR